MLWFEARKTLKLAVPVILGEIAQIALHLIDTAMVGAVSYKHLGAAALVMSVLNIPFVFGIGITIAIAQMTSLAHGKHDGKLVSHYFYNGFFLCAIASILIVLGMEFGKNIIFHLNQDPEVALLAAPYLRIMTWSLIPTILFFALKQFTDGLEFTKTAMILAVLALPLNVFLNWIMIFGNLGFPRMELIGAGYATLITRILIFLILGIIILNHSLFRKYIAVRSNQWKIRWATMKELLRIGIPSSFQISMEAGAFALSGIIVGTISAVALAAHQISLSIASFTFVISMGLSQASSIRSSNAFGQNNWKKISYIGRGSLRMAVIFGCLCGLNFIIFRNQLPLIFNENPEVITLASFLLIFAAIFQIPDSLQINSAGLLRGVKDVKTPTYFIAIAYWVVGIPIGCLLTFYFELGAMGIWLGLIIGLTFSSILLSSRFLKIIKTKKVPS